jgi:pimeloyl-ACP methyl ester carboxylesterase
MQTLLPGIAVERVPTERLTMAVLSVAGRTGEPVLFVHGNVSSSLFWQRTMLALPEQYRPLAVDLRGFGDTDPAPVDATRGLRDYADDVAALIEALALTSVHLVGWSMGGGVLLQYLADRPTAHAAASVTLEAPVSPFGFGGTFGTQGTLCDPAGAGSGGGSANADFVARLAAGDRSADGPTSPRQVLLAHYVKPPFVPADLDIFVESMLSTRVGDDHYPGTASQVPAWPGFAPGDRGVLNTMAPTHFRIASLAAVEPKPPVLWVRGTDDVIVSDTSLYDLGYLGSIGAVPGWPGPDAWPPQPMVAQTRGLLDDYAAAGGRYRETVIQDSGHGPHLDQAEQFLAALTRHLADASAAGLRLADLDRGPVGADLLPDVPQVVGVEAHGEHRVGTALLRRLDQPVLGLDAAVVEHFRHAPELAADHRLEPGAELGTHVAATHSDAKDLAEDFGHLISGQIIHRTYQHVTSLLFFVDRGSSGRQ